MVPKFIQRGKETRIAKIFFKKKKEKKKVGTFSLPDSFTKIISNQEVQY